MISPAPTTLGTTQAGYDRLLVDRFKSGDETAFDEIVRRYRKTLCVVAMSHIQNASDAEEVVQDTFVRAYRGLHKFRGECSLSTWLHTITNNLSRNLYWFWRRRMRHAHCCIDARISEGSGDTFADLIPGEIDDAAREAENQEYAAAIRYSMARLNPKKSQILLMVTERHLSYKEAAAALGTNIGTVKSRLARARIALRKAVDERMGVSAD